MDLSNDLVSQFAKITTGDKDKNNETTVYGTVKVYDGITCVKIDGSDLLTPVDTTTEVKEGERVTVLIKNHSAVITGNTSDPSAGLSTTDGISQNVTKVTADIGEFKELTTENFRATNAAIDNLTAKDAQIENLVATKASIEELEVVQAKIKDLDVEFINAEMANINDALIQKADIKDLEVSNANIKELQADTARIDEALITKADVTVLESTWADIDSLEADIAEIDTALIGKATIEDLNAVRAEISDLNVTELEATVADINLALITKANIEDLQAYQADIEKLQADTAKIDEALINKADIQDLNVVNAKIDNLNVDSLRASIINVENALLDKADVNDLKAVKANIDNLEVNVAKIDVALIDKASVSQLVAVEAQIENLGVEQLRADVAEIDEALINKANVTDLNATNATIQDLTARVGVINDAMIGKASIEELQAVEAQIEDLDVDQLRADVARIDEVVVNKADIADLNAANADIDILNTQVADINTLVNGNLTSDNITSLHLTAANTTMDNAFIKDAMIDSVTANKITAGAIDTNKITIKSTDGSMILSGSVQQFKDENGKVRIQIGKDSGGNFTFVLYDSTGNGVLIDEDGIKSSNAIADGLIVDSKVAENANISGSKLDITSVITEVNNDNSTTIKSNKIYLDEQGQSLEVAFNSLKTQVETIQDVTIDGDLSSVMEQVQTNTTQINANKSNISTLMSENTLRKEEIKDLDDEIAEVNTTMSNQYTSLEQDLSGFKNTVGKTYATKSSVTDLSNNLKNNYSTTSAMNSAITQKANEITNTVSQTYTTKTEFNNLQNEIDDVDNKLTKNYSTTAQMNSAITQKANEITNAVSQTYASKTELNNLQVGGKNLVANSAPVSTSGWLSSTNWGISLVDCNKAPNAKALRVTAKSDGITSGGTHKQPIDYTKLVNGANYTISAWIRASKQIQMDFRQEAMDVNNYVTVTTEWKYYTFTHSINTSNKYHSDVFYITNNNSIATGDWFEVHSLKLEKGDKATDWTPAPEDVDNKIYDVESKIQQTADAWTATFASSGGYNLIRNSTGSNSSTSQWTTPHSDVTFTTGSNDSHTGSPNRYFMSLKNETTSERYAYSTRFRLKPNTTYRFTGYFDNYTACKSFDVFILGSSTLAETDGTFNYDEKHVYKILADQNTNGAWKKLSVTFTTNSGVRTGYLRIDHNGYNSSGTNTPSLHWSAISLTQGEAEVPWSPHPDEIYSGITTIDATGIKVKQTGYSGYTQMSANGFYVNDGTTDAVKITKDGAVFTGKMVVQSGSTIPTTTLTGKVTSSQLDSAVTTDISTAKTNASTALSTANTAKTNASTALSTANTAKSTADGVKSTVDAGKTNWNNAYNRVNEWAYGAVTGSTTIDGGLIQTDTILAKHIAITDFNNYCVQPYNSTMTNDRGQTVPAYDVNPMNHGKLSKETIYGLVGGEQFRVKCKIRCGATADDIVFQVDWRNTSHTSIAAGNVLFKGTANSIISGDGIITVPAKPSDAAYCNFKIYSGNTSSGVKVSDVIITRMSNGELIVDGSITADKISSNAVTAGKISAGAITADKLAANAVTAAKIAANTITGDKIAAGTIDTTKMTIGDTTNLCITDIYSNIYDATIKTNSDGSKYFQVGDTSANAYYSLALNKLTGGNRYFKRNDVYRISYQGYASANCQMSFIIRCKYTDGTTTDLGVFYFDLTTSYTEYIKELTITNSIDSTKNVNYVSVFIETRNHNKIAYLRNISINKKSTGELIVDGAITAAKIAANTITADRIASGAITTDELAANAVTAAKIASNAITADKIASNAITADKIAAGAITAKHVIIADSSNILIASPSENPYGSVIYEASDGSKYFKFGNETTLGWYSCFMAKLGKNVSVKSTDKFRLIFRAYATVAVTINFIWRLTYTDGTYRDIIHHQIPITTSSTVYEKEITANYHEPYYTKTIKSSEIFFEFPNTALGYAYVKDASLVRKSGGDLIVDGSITAGKIAANAVTTDKLNANAVTAAKIASSAITADKISSGAITTDKLAANAITAGKIASNAVTTDKLNANAVTAAKIASNAVTADKVAAGAITTNKLAVKDGTNYSQLTDQTASYWGWTKQTNSSDEYDCWYQMNNINRDNQISEYYPCKGGESLRVKADIFTSVYGQSQKNGTATATARPVTVMIFTQNTNNGKSHIAAERVTATSTSGTTKTISTVITLPTAARRFAVYIQIDGYPTFSGTLKVRNVIVNKMSSGELIVDGSITADKIAAGAITADMISGGTLSAADEINFVGGARIFGAGGEHGATLSISASEYYLSGASQGFLGGNWTVDNKLTVNGTSTLTGAVTTGGNLTVAGTAKSKTLNVTSTSTLSGGVTCGSTLSAKGITSSTTLNVTGASTLTGAVTCGSSLSIGNVLNLQQYSVYLGTIWQTVNAPAIKFGTDSYVVGHSGIHIIDTSGNAQTLRAGTIYSNGSTVTSDRRKKMDIRYVNVDKQSIGDSGRMAPNTNITIQDMHEFIGSLPLTSFRYKDEVKSNRNLTHYGFLTQDIMYSKVGSELVTMLDESKHIGDEEDYTGYSVEKLLMFVCGALQEEIHQRQLLEKEIKNLKEGK